MTLSDAKKLLQTLGLTLKHDPGTGEYRVNFKNGAEATAYYTDDLDDAVGTGKKMVAANPKCEFCATSPCICEEEEDVDENPSKLPPLTKKQGDFIAFLERTLIPDLKTSESYNYAVDFEAAIRYIKDPFRGKVSVSCEDASATFDDAEHMIAYLRETIGPDTESSGMVETAEDLFEAADFIEERLEAGEPDENPQRGPGKFEKDLHAALWHLTLDGVGEEVGDSSEGDGWYGIMHDVTRKEVSDAAGELGLELTEEELEDIDGAAVILNESSDGFVHVDIYPGGRGAEFEWKKIVEAVGEDEGPEENPPYSDYSPEDLKIEMVRVIRDWNGSLDDFDVEAAIYWFASDYHGGQNDPLYGVLSLSEFTPGPTHKSVKDEGVLAETAYGLLEEEFCEAE